MITGNDMRRIRNALGETQPQFARRLGLAHYQRVLEMEKLGDKRIPAVTEIKLLDAGLDKFKCDRKTSERHPRKNSTEVHRKM